MMAHQRGKFFAFLLRGARYPRFRSGHHKRRPTGAPPASRREGTRLRLARIGQCLRVVWTWPGLDPQTLDSSAVSLSCDPAGCWFVVPRADVQKPDPIPTTGDGVGVKLGSKDCLVLSEGERIAHPRHMDRYERPWMRFQRILARMPRGSVDRAKATVNQARAHATVCGAWGDFPVRTSTDLVGRLDAGALEDLVEANMVKNRKLAKALGGTRWCQFRALMVYPAQRCGCALAVVSGPYPSSKTCSALRGPARLVSLATLRWTGQWRCPGWGTMVERGVGVARNISSAAGLAVSVRGGEVTWQGFAFPLFPARQEPVGASPQAIPVKQVGHRSIGCAGEPNDQGFCHRRRRTNGFAGMSLSGGRAGHRAGGPFRPGRRPWRPR
jgi:putative transposase